MSRLAPPICPRVPLTLTLSHGGERGRSIVGEMSVARTLILGGARSGKSRYALELGESLGVDRVLWLRGWGLMWGCGSGLRGIGRIGMCLGGRWRRRLRLGCDWVGVS